MRACVERRSGGKGRGRERRGESGRERHRERERERERERRSWVKSGPIPPPPSRPPPFLPSRRRPDPPRRPNPARLPVPDPVAALTFPASLTPPAGPGAAAGRAPHARGGRRRRRRRPPRHSHSLPGPHPAVLRPLSPRPPARGGQLSKAPARAWTVPTRGRLGAGSVRARGGQSGRDSGAGPGPGRPARPSTRMAPGSRRRRLRV